MNIIIGDSHSKYIKITKGIHYLCLAGSAKGLNNSNSKSNYNNLILQFVKKMFYTNLIFLFGGVDLEFVFIDKYVKDNNIDYEEFNLNVINNYLSFITKNFYDKKVTILSVGLPCVDDDNFVKVYINNGGRLLDFENIDPEELKNSNLNIPNIFTRTEITIDFNKKLEEEIKKINKPNIQFLDITTFTYDEELKRIKDIYFTKKDNHNYVRNKDFIKIIEEHLLKN